MKKLLFLFTIPLIIGCGGERENQVNASSSDAVYTVTVEGHKYAIYDGYHQGGIVHAESCECKEGKRPNF